MGYIFKPWNKKFREIETMKQIPLRGKKGQGKFLLVDDEDYELLSKFDWYLRKDGYATTTIKSYRLVMGITDTDGKIIDHQNRNKLDDRRSNLRIATHAQNMQNKKVHKNNKVGYKGVVKRPTRTKPYHVFIGGVETGKADYIGAYTTAEEAAKVYDKEAKKRFGEFAYLNFPEDK